MSTPKQALLRPIEITDSNNVITIASTNYTIAEGIYPNVLAVVRAIKGIGGAITDAYLNADFKAVIVRTGGGAITKTALSDLLGYTGSETGTTYTATYTPAYSWISYRRSSDSNQFASDPESEFSGAVGTDGNLCGITMSSRESVTKSWKWIASANAYPSCATVSYTATGSVVRFPEKYSNFWTTVTESRSATSSTYGKASTKGLYYFDDVSVFLGASPTVAVPTVANWTSGGTQLQSANGSHVDNYVFCSADPPRLPPASDNSLLSYYDADLRLTTAIAPTWG